ncbi:Thrombospondin-3a, partial [Dissostichus eleginoides]
MLLPVLMSLLWAAGLSAGAETQVVDVLALQDSKQSVSAVERLSSALSALPDLYVLSTLRLPSKLGGVLLGVYSRTDNRKYLEVAVMGKINKVLVRYVRSDGKLHTVNLHHAALADGRSHSIILRLGGLQRASMSMELYVDCRLADSSQGLPSLVPLPQEAELVELRHGQKAYARLQGDASAYNSVSGELNSILGDHTKALIGQLIIFNQILGELRMDIREQ